MKRIIFLLFATFLFVSPAYAKDTTTDMQKNQCVLASKDCKGIVDSIQMKSEKLKIEIEKGTKVYTPEEMDKLKAKLKEAETMLDNYLND